MRRRHTTGSLLGLLPSLVNLASNVRADGVTWISPAAGDVYNSGDTIVGQWTSNSSFSSPSFSLCSSSPSGGDGSSAECGSAVWPLVETNGDTKMVHLSLPSSPAASFHLEMSDATSGQSVNSPSFSLNSASAAPASSAHFPVEVPATTAAAATHQTSVSSSIQPLPDLNSLSRPTPTAAYAVPLSLVGTVLLVAGVLGVYHRRKLRKEQLQKSGRPPYQRAASSYTRSPQRHFKASVASSIESRPSTPTASVTDSYHDPKSYEESHAPTEDGRRSLYTLAPIKRQPMARRATREPFQRDVPPPRVIYDRRRQAKISAGAFRAGVSPVPPRLSRFSSIRSGASTIRREKAQARLARRSQDADDDLGTVVDRYFYPSPRLPPPDRLHIRRGTKDYPDLPHEKPLPRRPSQPHDGPAARRRASAGRDLVHQKISGNRY